MGMSNISKSFQDYYISKSFEDYDGDDPEINFRKNRWKYWSLLKLVRVEFMEDKLNSDGYDFETYIEDKYGIKMNMVNGNITDGYQIVDEKKYLIFLLRFE
jgi:hypothetical protein